MILSTLCYIEKDGAYLMLHRNKKEKDVNEGKWIGVGGKFLPGESPEECVCREVLEETGLVLDAFCLRGILTFASEGWEDEIIFVYTADRFHSQMYSKTGEAQAMTAGAPASGCDEGTLSWTPFSEIPDLNLWEGDRIFLKLLIEKGPFFSLKLSYRGDALIEKKLVLHESV